MKKKFFTHLLMCVLCAFSLSACFGFNTGIETERIRSYVVAFGEFTSFGMELTDRNNIVLYWPGTDGRWVSFQDRGLEGRRYDELATQYNDLSYNRKTRFGPLPPRRYVSNGIVSIDMVSDTDFDAEYPAGTSLANFVRLLSVSPMRFIESGYRATFNWQRDYPACFLRETATFHNYFMRDVNGRNFPQNHFPISEVLSELAQDDFRLLGTGDKFPLPSGGWELFFGFLVFDKKPENSGTHNLTVTIRRTNGRILSQTIEKAF